MRVAFDVDGVRFEDWLPPLLDALTAVNVAWLARRPHPVPSILAGSVRYQREPTGSEVWRPLPVVLGSGFGDCEDLCAARAAELQAAGIPAEAFYRVVGRRGSTDLIHILVRLPDGTVEDPSAALGMRTAA